MVGYFEELALGDSRILGPDRENLNNREEQTDGKSIDNTKGV